MSDDFRLQVSVKTRNDDLINVRGATPEEFENALKFAEANMPRLIQLGQLAKAVGNAQDAGLTSAPVQQNQQPQTSGWTSSAPAPVGASGEMVPKHGFKNGKEWRGYFPKVKGTGDPQFANFNTPEWHAIGQALGV